MNMELIITLANWKMGNGTVMVKWFGSVAKLTMVAGAMDSGTDMEHNLLLMEASSTKASGKKMLMLSEAQDSRKTASLPFLV